MMVTPGIPQSRWLLAGAALMWVAACAKSEPPPAPIVVIDVSPPAVTVPGDQPVEAANLNQMVAMAKTDLAQRLSVDADAITVVEAQAVTWRSGALGCPQPGMMYTDALVPGVSIRLSADKDIYCYHSGRGNDVFYCPEARVEQPASAPFPQPD